MKGTSLTGASGSLPEYADLSRLVYVVQAVDDAPIKIGVASDVEKRLASLQTGNPRALQLLHVLPGDGALEWSLHKSLAADRLVGEWFDGERTREFLLVAPDLAEWAKHEFERTQALPDYRRFHAWPWIEPASTSGHKPLTIRHMEPSPSVDPDEAKRRLVAHWTRPRRPYDTGTEGISTRC